MTMKQSSPFLFDGVNQMRWTSIVANSRFPPASVSGEEIASITIDGYRTAITDKVGKLCH